MFHLKFLLLVAICAIAWADDKKWVWGDNNRNEKSASRFNAQNDGDASARYEVFEPDYYERPDRPNFTPINRPANLYNERPQGTYGQGHLHNNYPDYGPGPNPGILTGPVPSWIKEGPYKNFDKCKCTEKFNCNSPGISYGHCDVGKQYCCYSTKGEVGGPLPSRPVHSIENGVLVGPGGPVDGPRPQRPGYPRPGGGFGRPGGPGGPIGGGRPVHSIENGVLVGPGGPFDRPHGGRPGGGFGGGFGGGGYGGGYGAGYGGYARSANSKKE